MTSTWQFEACLPWLFPVTSAMRVHRRPTEYSCFARAAPVFDENHRVTLAVHENVNGALSKSVVVRAALYFLSGIVVLSARGAQKHKTCVRAAEETNRLLSHVCL